MNIVPLDTLRRVFDRVAVLDAVRDGLIAHAEGRVRTPAPGQLLFDDPPGDCHVKYGWRLGGESFVIKMASSFYRNPEIGLPVNDGLMLRMCARTGRPLTLFLDQGWLTAWRTAAAITLAAQAVAPEGAATVGVVGAGHQAALALEWIAATNPHWRRLLWARNPARAAATAEAAGARVAESLPALLAEADVVITVTPAAAPLFAAKDTRPHQGFVAAGADAPGKAELPPALFATAAAVVVDDPHQTADHSDLGNALRAGIVPPPPVLLGDMLAGRVTLPPGLRIADLTGIAAQDIAIADLFARLSAARGPPEPETPSPDR